MKKFVLIFLILPFSNQFIKAQVKNYHIKFETGFAHLKYKGVKNAFQTGFSLEIAPKKKLGYQIDYSFILGSRITEDRRDLNPQVFHYNSHVQQSQFNGLLQYPILDGNTFKIDLQTGISFNFLKQSFVNNIYKKELFPNQPLILVSESTFEKKFQLGSISSLETSFKLKRCSPGISLQYQLQKEYQFFSPSIFISYKL